MLEVYGRRAFFIKNHCVFYFFVLMVSPKCFRIGSS